MFTEKQDSFNTGQSRCRCEWPSWVRNIFIPALWLLFVLWADRRIFSGFSVVPMISILSLFVFAILIERRWMVFWTTTYVGCVVLSLWMGLGRWTNANGNAVAMLTTRTVSSITAGTMACMLSRLKKNQDVSRREMSRFINHLSIPTITSDENGWILGINNAALALFNDSDILGKPYFSFFHSVTEKGRSIQRYLDLISGTTPGPISIDLLDDKNRKRVFPSTLSRLTIDGKDIIITMIYPTMDERDKGFEGE